MDHKDNVISAFAKNACKNVSEKVIKDLRKVTMGMQLGDDSNLKHIWDEICVQVQDKELWMWEFYIDIIENLIQHEVERLDAETISSIWLQTKEGSDWKSDIGGEIGNEEIKEPNTTEYYVEDITKYILRDFVLKAAASWTNKRIEKYIERQLA